MKKRDLSLLMDVAGVLLAFVIAFGGLFLVQGLLTEEETRLLGGSGAMEIAVKAEDAQPGEVEVQPVVLTQEELVQVVGCLNKETEVGLHEPLSGQLSMAQAVQCGREWLSEFCLPHLGMETYVPQEYTCYLWGRLENGEDDSEKNRLFSYWTIVFTEQDISANLVLNAVTGQVLSATVRCPDLVEYREDNVVEVLLEDYWESFGIEASYYVRDWEGGGLVANGWSKNGRVLGNSEISAILETASMVVSSAQSEYNEYQDCLIVHLYLELMD